MYRLSLLPRKVLITTDEVIAQGPTDNSVDPRNLLLAIQIAEERFIKPALGKDLYYDLRLQKNTVVDIVNKAFLEGLVNTGNTSDPVVLQVGDIINALEFVSSSWYKELWNEHLWKLTAECVVFIASPTNFSRYTSAGEMENNPKSITNEGQGAATVDLSKMKWKLDKILMDRIDPLLTAMHDWICDNSGQFALYTKDCGCGELKKGRQTAWVKNIYNDRSNECCD